MPGPDPPHSVFISLLGNQLLLINLTEVAGGFAARKGFADQSLLQGLIEFNCIHLSGAGIVVLLCLCAARSDTGSG